MKTGKNNLPLSSTITKLSNLFERIGWAKSAAIISSCSVVALILIRTYYSLVTGYLLPDEAYYYGQFIVDQVPVSTYRPFFHVMFLLFFQGTDGMVQLFLRGALYSSLWAVGTVLVLYKILRALEVPDRAAAVVILSLPLFPVFAVMAVFFVTEILGLFLALLGIFYSILYIKNSKLVDVLLSALFFVLAYEAREPYLLLGLGNFFVLLLVKRRAKGLIGYALIISIILPIPAALHPIAFTQPISDFIFVSIPNFLGSLQASVSHTVTSIISSSATHITSTSSSSTATSVTTSSTESSVTAPAPTALPLTISWNEVVAFIEGLLYGFGPLFLVLVPFSIYFANRNKTNLSVYILLIMLLSLCTFLVASDTEIAQLPSGIGPWLSDFIRLSSSAVPVLAGFGYLYSKIGSKRISIILLVYVVLASAFVPQLANVLQSSQNSTGQPIDRLSLSYTAPYYRMYEIAANSGETLIIGGASMRGIVVYASFLPNVILSGIPPTQQALNALLDKNWSSIFLYDDYYTIESPSLISVYPAYYQTIVLSRSYDGYSIQPVWVDAESYVLELIKS